MADKVITSIAQQTNPLELNATIRAPRVGDAGKGLVMAANGVEELAKAAEYISSPKLSSPETKLVSSQE